VCFVCRLIYVAINDEVMETDVIHVVVIGHSYVRRLKTWMSEHPSRANLRFDPDRVRIHCFGLGGASFRARRKYFVDYVHSVMSHLSFQASVVVIHIGENDVLFTDSACLTQQIRNVFDLLSVRYAVPVTVVSQLLVFPVFDHKRASVVDVNLSLELAFRGNSKFLFWKHRGFWNSVRNYYRPDNVHLNEDGMLKYWRSMHVAVRTAVRGAIGRR
jgi:hypothetical protein